MSWLALAARVALLLHTLLLPSSPADLPSVPSRPLLLIVYDHTTNSTSEYGSLKSKLLSVVSIDNKIRFCLINGIKCVIGKKHKRNTSMQVDTARVLKLEWINTLLHSEEEEASTLIYLDLDTIILDPQSCINPFECDDQTDILASSSIALTPDYRDYNDRFQSGVLFVRPTIFSKNLFATLNDKLARTHHSSDQLLLNDHLSSVSHTLIYSSIKNVSRIRYNAFPTLPPPWTYMGLPVGDEIEGITQIVHFAGVFGGISSEDGRPDPLPTLIAVKGFIERHLHFQVTCLDIEARTVGSGFSPYKYQQYNPFQRQSKASSRTGRTSSILLDTGTSISILHQAIAYITACTNKVFGMYDIELANTEALRCLKVTYNTCWKLLTKKTKRRLTSSNSDIVVF